MTLFIFHGYGLILCGYSAIVVVTQKGEDCCKHLFSLISVKLFQILKSFGENKILGALE
jgi:hypothetical protein